MHKTLVTYYSRGGNTQLLAEMLAESLREEDIEVTIKPVTEVDINELLEYEGIVIGSPTYYGQMASEVKKLIDNTHRIHKKLDGKVGLVFTTSADIATGAETTLLSIIHSMLVNR